MRNIPLLLVAFFCKKQKYWFFTNKCIFALYWQQWFIWKFSIQMSPYDFLHKGCSGMSKSGKIKVSWSQPEEKNVQCVARPVSELSIRKNTTLDTTLKIKRVYQCRDTLCYFLGNLLKTRQKGYIVLIVEVTFFLRTKKSKIFDH